LREVEDESGNSCMGKPKVKDSITPLKAEKPIKKNMVAAISESLDRNTISQE
jgi:hypothetical protein